MHKTKQTQSTEHWQPPSLILQKTLPGNAWHRTHDAPIILFISSLHLENFLHEALPFPTTAQTPRDLFPEEFHSSGHKLNTIDLPRNQLSGPTPPNVDIKGKV